MNPPIRRALTLIEVLAATVLLAILSSVCASLLRGVPVMRTEPATETNAIDMMALEGAAEELLDDPGLHERLVTDSSAEFSMPWPDEPARPSIAIRRVEHESSAEKPSRAWVAFSCEQCIVWRCVELPRENPTP